MATIKSTKDIALRCINVLLYGSSGAGKTWQIRTLDKPFVIAAEKGLLTLSGTDVDYVEVSNYADLVEVMNSLQSIGQEGGYKTIVLDSVSELCELTLAEEKTKSRNQLQAYGQLNDLVMSMIRGFINIPLDVVFIAKQDKFTNPETGEQKYCAEAPGSKVPLHLPYFFDEVFALRTRVVKDENGASRVERAIQTADDGVYNCKDRSGKLDVMERADLGAIFRKMRGVTA